MYELLSCTIAFLFSTNHLPFLKQQNKKIGYVTMAFEHNKVDMGILSFDPIPFNVAQCCSISLDFLADALIAILGYVIPREVESSI